MKDTGSNHKFYDFDDICFVSHRGIYDQVCALLFFSMDFRWFCLFFFKFISLELDIYPFCFKQSTSICLFFSSKDFCLEVTIEFISKA